jgi:serine protease Do
MLGKELRNAQDNTWLNYAVPIANLREAVEDIKTGKRRPRRDERDSLARRPVDLPALGVVLVPELVDKTPPFVDTVRSGSVAAKAGLQADDLVLFVNNVLVQSLDDLLAECLRIERDGELRLTVRRGDAMKVILLTPAGNLESRQ